MLKSLFCEDISVEYEFSQFSLYLSGNTTDSKHYRRAHAHIDIYILFYIFAMDSVKICRFKTFWVRIFARGTLLLFRCFDIHVKMCVLLRYCARK